MKRLIIVFNRNHTIISLSLSIVKKSKKSKSNDTITNNTKKRNENAWTVSECEKLLASFDAPRGGYKDTL